MRTWSNYAVLLKDHSNLTLEKKTKLLVHIYYLMNPMIIVMKVVEVIK